MPKTAKPKWRTFADLVDLADSGETEGRVQINWTGATKIWRQVPVSNAPETIVFSARGTSWCYEVAKLRTDPRLRESIKRTAAMGRLPEVHGPVTVSFKHEDTQQGQPVGPVVVIDDATYDQDPEIARARESGQIGIPFGYKPQGQSELGWLTLSRARKVATHYGVGLTEH